ncbi:glycosyltransferase [Bacillus tianshenii]|nr:glycosyltransferase [Bacillus tianshenii]
MKIIHGPIEIAGQVGITARAQRAVGYASVSAVHSKNRYNYKNDIYIHRKEEGHISRWFKKGIFLKSYLTDYDVYHFHFAEPFYRYKGYYFDTKLLKKMNKKLFIEFWGNDIRLPKLEKKRNPFYVDPYNLSDEINIEKMKKWADITEGKVIVADHSFNIFLEKYFDDINIVGQRIEIENFSPSFPNPDNKVPLVVHAPSLKAFKGTSFLQKAVENLKKKGLEFEYLEITNKPNEEALQLYSKADIIVDQLCAGSHGIFACEAMALGKPVICYILPELINTYNKGFPIINANPDTIELILEEWILKHEERYKLGVKSREYVERVHDAKIVANKLIDIYIG